MRKNRKTFLVTGGTGFIGSNICQLLVNANHSVKIFDNNSRGSISKIKKIKRKIKFIRGDIRNRESLNKALKNTDAVIHLAYINGTKYFYSNPVLVLDIAIKGILNIIEACIKNRVKELYLASSSEVYQTPHKIPTDELESLKIPDIFNPRYSYGGGKILTELMGVHYGKKYFKKLIIFRPHNVYGPDMGSDHVIPEFIKRFKTLKRKKFKIQGTGNEIRSFIYIEDFIDAFELILKKGKHLNIYNIGTSEKIKIKELAFMLSRILKKKIILKKTSLARGGTKVRIPDINKIIRLGFKPKFNLDKGLKKILL
ncbi:MAG: SDR family NAD(P)-dependent oxidoreductase [Pelagibacteraceae bacterium]|nr:SDR family NAD(P)-dependent oxidoreductase [Pelagibacteraceae bacterium]